MSFIIVHVPVPSDIESYSCMPDDTGKGIEYFNSSHEAFECLEIMGLEFDSDWSIIQKKFKTLVKKFHPDRNLGNKQFEDKLKKITLAYSHLKLIMIRK